MALGSSPTKHEYPDAGETYSSTIGQVDYDRLFLGYLNNYQGRSNESDALEGDMEGYITGAVGCSASDPHCRFAQPYQGQEPGYGVPRTCFGNKFTNDAHYTTDGYYASSPAVQTLSDTLKPVDGHRFTIVLTDDQNKVVDVFSVAQDSSDINAQNDLTIEGFDFSAAGPGFPATSALAVANVDLSSYSWTKTNLAPASSRNSYVITVASEGSYGSIGGTTGTTGNPKWSLDDSSSFVKVLRADPGLGDPPGANIGDPESTFRLEAKLNAGLGVDILRVGFKIFKIDNPDLLLPSATNFLGMDFNSSTGKYQATFVPFSESLGNESPGTSTAYGVIIEAQDEDGTKRETLNGGATIFTIDPAGPVQQFFSTSPNINNGVVSSLELNSLLTLSVSAIDLGTSVISDVYVEPVQSSGAALGITYPFQSTDGINYTTDFVVSGDLTPDTTYHLKITSGDSFGHESEVSYTSYEFKLIEAPYLNPNPYVVSVVKSETLTIADLRTNGITVIPVGMPGSLDDVNYEFVSLSSELDSCSLVPSTSVSGVAQKLEIIAGSTPGTGYCTISLELGGVENTSNS